MSWSAAALKPTLGCAVLTNLGVAPGCSQVIAVFQVRSISTKRVLRNLCIHLAVMREGRHEPSAPSPATAAVPTRDQFWPMPANRSLALPFPRGGGSTQHAACYHAAYRYGASLCMLAVELY
jgi:hypothetical protein